MMTQGVVEHKPLVNAHLGCLFWLLDGAHVLMYNYDDNLINIYPLSLGGLEEIYTLGHVQVAEDGSIISVVLVGHAMNRPGKGEQDASENLLDAKQHQLVRISTYEKTELKEEEASKPMVTQVLDLKDVRPDSHTVITGIDGIRLINLTHNGDVQYRRIRPTTIDFQKTLRLWVSEPCLRPPIKYVSEGHSPPPSQDSPLEFCLDSFASDRFAKASMLFEYGTDDCPSLVFSPKPGSSRQLVQVQALRILPAIEANPQKTATKGGDEKGTKQPNHKTGNITRDLSTAGALCDACSAILDRSELLDRSSMWRATRKGREARSSDRDILANQPGTILVFDQDGEAVRVQAEPEATINTGTEHRTGRGDKKDDNQDDAEELPCAARYEHYLHHDSLHSFIISALRGCHLCAIFLDLMDNAMRVKAGNLMEEIAQSTSSKSQFSQFIPRANVGETISTTDFASSPLSADEQWIQKTSQKGYPGTQLIVRIKSETANPKDNGQIALYKPGAQNDPEWKAEPFVRRLDRRDAEALEERNRRMEDLCPHEHDNLCCAPRTMLTSSPATIALARGWLSECLAIHPCSAYNSRKQPPTRVIDVSPTNSSHDVCLRITNAQDRGMQYLTLSHCWGLEMPIKLTTSNLQQLTRSISLSDLPRTFRDAVSICRALGQRFLWIDSLCIIQEGDDFADWEREAARMADVYGNSLCTLAARSSTSVESGCHRVRRWLRNIDLTWHNRSGETFIIPGPGKSIKEEINLETRGWVFQERLLSPRIIGFSTNGIYWECQSKTANEEHMFVVPHYERDAATFNPKEMFSQVQSPRLHGVRNEADRRSFLSAWFELVEEYASLRFTHERDRLIAMVGISSVIRQASGLNYFYGLWNDIHHPEVFLSQLLWSAQFPQRDAGSWYVATSRLPTFSWVSFSGKVDHRATFHTRKINQNSNRYFGGKSRFSKVQSSNGNPNTGHYMEFLPLGRLKLILRSRIPVSDPFEMTDVTFPTKTVFLAPSKGRIALKGPVRDITLDEKDFWSLQMHYPWAPEEGTATDRSEYDGHLPRWFFPDKMLMPADGKAKCLTIATWRRTWNHQWYVAGLVLAKTSNRTYELVENGPRTEQFVRIGYFEHSWKTQHRDWSDQGQEQLVLIG